MELIVDLVFNSAPQLSAHSVIRSITVSSPSPSLIPSFVPGEVKTLMVQLLRAVQHLHDNWILHRDLKTSNLLLSHKGILKVREGGTATPRGFRT